MVHCSFTQYFRKNFILMGETTLITIKLEKRKEGYFLFQSFVVQIDFIKVSACLSDSIGTLLLSLLQC